MQVSQVIKTTPPPPAAPAATTSNARITLSLADPVKNVQPAVATSESIAFTGQAGCAILFPGTTREPSSATPNESKTVEKGLGKK